MLDCYERHMGIIFGLYCCCKMAQMDYVWFCFRWMELWTWFTLSIYVGYFLLWYLLLLQHRKLPMLRLWSLDRHWYPAKEHWYCQHRNMPHLHHHLFHPRLCQVMSSHTRPRLSRQNRYLQRRWKQESFHWKTLQSIQAPKIHSRQ